MAQFREGAIDSITMENWMAYTGPVRLKAMPGVNIIAAANGCGKSAIVCAIALGLGFEPSVLARGDNIRSFIKRGFSKAKLQIGLVDSSAPDGVTVVERSMIVVQKSSTGQSASEDPEHGGEETEEGAEGLEEAEALEAADAEKKNKRKADASDEEYRGEAAERREERLKALARKAAKARAAKEKAARDKAAREREEKERAAREKGVKVPAPAAKPTTTVRNEWAINGKPATLDMVRQLQKRLNVQINNLLTFLAQANVGKFAAMSPQQLFRSTLSAIQPSLCRDLDSLTEMAKQLKVQRSKMQMLVDDLNSTTVKIAQLKVISDTLGRMKDATLYANLVKQRLYRIKLNNLDKGCKATRTRLNSMADEYKRTKEEKAMLDQKLKELTAESKRLHRHANLKLAKAKGIHLLSTVKPDKKNVSMVMLADDNELDKAFYNAMTAMRTFAANNKSRSAGVQTRVVNKDVIEKRLAMVNKEIEILKMQIAGENELTAEIAECRMTEETLKSKLLKLQGAAVKRYDDIQVDNLLKKLNAIKRDCYRQFIRWRREQLNIGASGTGGRAGEHVMSSVTDKRANDRFGTGDAASEGSQCDSARKLPKLLVSDIRVCGRTNCCIIEEAASRYMDCLLLTPESSLSVSAVLNRFKLPSVTAPETPPVLCKVTERMREFGVKQFLHELVESNDPATKATLASVAKLGTAFVVDEEVMRGQIEREIAARAGSGGSPKRCSMESFGTVSATESFDTVYESANTSAPSSARKEVQKEDGRGSASDDGAHAGSALEGEATNGETETTVARVVESADGGSSAVTCEPLERPTSEQTEKESDAKGDGICEEAVKRGLLDQVDLKQEWQTSNKNDVENDDEPVKRRKCGFGEQSTSHEGERQMVLRLKRSDAAAEDERAYRQRIEEEYFRRFYECMVEEIGSQVGHQVRVLRYYLGTKRHIYRLFKDADDLYSDYSVEIPMAPTILHDCTNVTVTGSVMGIEEVERELSDVAERLRVLGGMLYGRKQDNKVVGGRLYALSREQISLERTLQAIDSTTGGGRFKDKQKELDNMEKKQREEMKEAIKSRIGVIEKWVEKVKLRRTTLQEAHELYAKYKSVDSRKARVEDLHKLTSTTYDEVKAEHKRLEGTLQQQEAKHKQYTKDINELNILIKAISGEIVSSNLEGEQSESIREREALRIRQQKASKLDHMTEGDLERELQIAELNVKQLERDDCEETQNAREMRDAIIHEEKLSTDIAEAETNVRELSAERERLYAEWIRRVNAIIAQVDANFGRYMQHIGDGAAGQIRLEAKLEDIKEAKVKVLIKFHRDRDLLPLASSYQSGGERGVTTMVYILAVQHLTSNAFFVIDEINQGLDSNYETRIMALLLRTHVAVRPGEEEEQEEAGGAGRGDGRKAPPQYFVLTPQLLPGIDLRGATLHFPLNGPGVVNGMVI
ncbi:chromosome maintenance protein [Babesia caballi]|uniref:Structural maintenance of chromosomes protein 5 n=1 Tax=Babesia caballi TaxID=5871 RepID=A0AAV4LZW2_BABCB|nr:chromosome maintenance protein [Babesia caballi]